MTCAEYQKAMETPKIDTHDPVLYSHYHACAECRHRTNLAAIQGLQRLLSKALDDKPHPE